MPGLLDPQVPQGGLLGFLRDPQSWQDMGQRLGGLLGAPLPSVAELNAMIPTAPSQVNPALEAQGYAKLPALAMGGIIAGPGAHTADISALREAQTMEAAGHAPEGIWQKTGWWRGPDAKWRYEISDQGAVVNKPTSARRVGNLAQLLGHNELYAAYPELTRIATTQEPNDAMILSTGLYAPAEGAGAPSSLPRALRNWGKWGSIANAAENGDMLNAYIHEAQHAVQNAEGRSSGASQLLAGPEEYHRNLGEVEARAAERRAAMTPEQRRATPPWESYDVPMSDWVWPR